MSTQVHAFNFVGNGFRSQFDCDDGTPAVEGGQ
jgi:hypothetical protein